MAGFTGYSGGLKQLLIDANVPAGVYSKRAVTFNVFHINGGNVHGQYRYSKFVQPIVQMAVDGGASRLVYLLTEGSQKPATHIPCAALVGDHDDVMKYLDDYTTKRPRHGIYYYYFCPKVGHAAKVKAFLDFDIVEKMPVWGSWESRWAEVYRAIEIVNGAFLTSLDTQQAEFSSENHCLDYVVSYNERVVKKTNKEDTKKFSFHVTWKNQGFDNIEDQKQFMAAVLGSSGCNYDDKVYTKGRLMRLPWCGKSGDVGATLYPYKFTFVPEEDDWIKERYDLSFTINSFDAFNIMPNTGADYTFHSFKRAADKMAKVSRIGTSAAADRSLVMNQRSKEILAFFKPLLNSHIIPLIQQHRRYLLTACGHVSTAGVPVKNFSVTNPEATNQTGMFRVSVTGDTFCEHHRGGSSPFYHDQRKITLAIDLRLGYYMQLCYSCNPTGNSIKKYALFVQDDFQIRPYTEHCPRVLDITKDQGGTLFLRHFNDDIMFNPNVNCDFFVFDDKHKLWVSDSNGRFLLTKMRQDFRKLYVSYRLACYEETLEWRLAHATTENARGKIKKERKFLENMQINHVEATRFINDLQAIYRHLFDYTDVKMNSVPHLVPLNDGTCYNVFTDTIVPRTKEMYFTSMLNGTVKTTFDEECRAIRDWFLEVSRGRPTLARYLKEVYGLTMTTLRIDRKFYTNLGFEGRNGKTVGFEMLEVHT